MPSRDDPSPADPLAAAAGRDDLFAQIGTLPAEFKWFKRASGVKTGNGDSMFARSQADGTGTFLHWMQAVIIYNEGVPNIQPAAITGASIKGVGSVGFYVDKTCHMIAEIKTGIVADQIKTVVAKLGGIGSNSPYFDPTAFAPVTQVRFGSTGRNILRGPGLVNLDASLFRNFRVREQWNIQLRGECYNVSNTPHFSNPSGNISAGGFLAITSALSRANNVEGGERQFRIALKVSF